MSSPHSPPTPSSTPSSLLPPLPVPTYGPGGSFSVISGTSIHNVSPRQALSAILETSSWPQWNCFCPKAEMKGEDAQVAQAAREAPGARDGEDFASSDPDVLRVGSVVLLDVFMNGDGLQPEKAGRSKRDQGIVVTRLEGMQEEDVDQVKRLLSQAWREGEPLLEEIERVGGYRVAWKSSGWSHWQLHSERVLLLFSASSISPSSPSSVATAVSTIFISFETFGGILAPVVKLAVGKQLIERFADYARDLKGFLETRNVARK